jgi:hypothetical protein
MKYFARAKIDGSPHNGSPPVQASVDNVHVQIERDSSDGQCWITVSFPAPDYRAYKPTIQREKEQPYTKHIHIPDNPYFALAVEWLQYIESIGSFWFGIIRILCDSATHGWTPESDSEETELQLFSASHTATYPPRRSNLSDRSLHDALRNRSRLDHLTVPLAFFREGVVEYHNHRYILAFF